MRQFTPCMPKRKQPSSVSLFCLDENPQSRSGRDRIKNILYVSSCVGKCVDAVSAPQPFKKELESPEGFGEAQILSNGGKFEIDKVEQLQGPKTIFITGSIQSQSSS